MLNNSSWIVNYFGYETAMLIKNLCIYSVGFSTGALILYFTAMRIVICYRKSDDMPDFSVVKVKHEKKNYYFANPANIWEASYVFFSCLFLSDDKPYRKKDDKIINKAKTFTVAFYMVLIVTLFLGIFLSISIVPVP